MDKPVSLTYRDSGVNIGQGEAFVQALGPLAKTTNRAGVCEGIGGFGGLFDLQAAGFKDPLLVAGSDGVGTKLLLASALEQHQGIGIDLVAMCVNDILCHGAEPLFFLDYFATGQLQQGTGLQLVEGIAQGCRQAGCALTGGETAEMPGLYGAGHYDLAGFALGAVERHALLPRKQAMQAGDILVGLASSGLHANGFSLVRQIIEHCGAKLEDAAPFDADQTLGAALLRPTRIYVQSLLPACRGEYVKGLAHITGGGLLANTRRMCPPNLRPELDFTQIPAQPVFDWLADAGPVEPDQMQSTFNMGVGMVAAVAEDQLDRFMAGMREAGETSFVLGELVACPD